MRVQRPAPARGLLAGLLTLIVLVSAAVAMTAHQPTATTKAGTTSLTAQAVAGTDRRSGDRDDLAIVRRDDGHHR